MGLGRLKEQSALPIMVGRVLRDERIKQGLTQGEVGARIGRSRGYVCDVEKRAHMGVTIIRLEVLAGALGLRASDVLREAELMRFAQHPLEEGEEAPSEGQQE